MPALRQLAPSGLEQLLAGGSVQADVTATLVPQPDNPYDANSVAVFVGRLLIGYLPRDVAPSYQPLLTQLAGEGSELTTECHVRYFTRSSFDGQEAGVGAEAELSLDEPWLCVPVNRPPRAAFALLPHGSALQVRKEDQHMRALRPHLRQEGETWAWGTLHRLDPSGRSTKPLVEVRIDDQRVGELTPAMSEHFLATIDALAEVSKQTAVKLRVTGNALKAEVVVYASKAHELPQTWLTTNLVPPSAADSSHQPAFRSGQTPLRFNPAPGWPAPPEGWTPPPGWQPSGDWPPAPPGWRFWV